MFKTYLSLYILGVFEVTLQILPGGGFQRKNAKKINLPYKNVYAFRNIRPSIYFSKKILYEIRCIMEFFFDIEV